MNANMAEPIQIDLNAFYGGSIVPRSQHLLKIPGNCRAFVRYDRILTCTTATSLRRSRGVSYTFICDRTAFAALNVASTDTAVVSKREAQGSCNDLQFPFLHATCSKKHKKRAWFKQHRVATFLVGRPDAITSSVKLPAQRAAVRLEIAPDSDHSGKSEEQKTACTQSWPYYNRICMLKQTGGNACVVRVIALDRQTPIR